MVLDEVIKQIIRDLEVESTSSSFFKKTWHSSNPYSLNNLLVVEFSFLRFTAFEFFLKVFTKAGIRLFRIEIPWQPSIYDCAHPRFFLQKLQTEIKKIFEDPNELLFQIRIQNNIISNSKLLIFFWEIFGDKLNFKILEEKAPKYLTHPKKTVRSFAQILLKDNFLI